MIVSKNGKVMWSGTTSEILVDFTMVCMDIIRHDIPIDKEDLINSVKIAKIFADRDIDAVDDIEKATSKIFDEFFEDDEK